MASAPPAPNRHPLGIATGLRLFFLWAPITGYASMWLLDGDVDGASFLHIARWSLVSSWAAMVCIAAVEAARLRRNGGRAGGLAVVACTLATVLAINAVVLLTTAMLASLATFD